MMMDILRAIFTSPIQRQYEYVQRNDEIRRKHYEQVRLRGLHQGRHNAFAERAKAARCSKALPSKAPASI